MADNENLDIYRELVARFFEDRVKGKANPYTSMNGNMYSFLDKAGTVCLRLSKDDRAQYVDRFGTRPVEQYGAIMKEYVALPADLLTDADAIEDAFRDCFAYARSLPTK